MIGRYSHPLAGIVCADERVTVTRGWGDAAGPAGSRVDGGWASESVEPPSSVAGRPG